jgi:hypothetical protein
LAGHGGANPAENDEHSPNTSNHPGDNAQAGESCQTGLPDWESSPSTLMF